MDINVHCPRISDLVSYAGYQLSDELTGSAWDYFKKCNVVTVYFYYKYLPNCYLKEIELKENEKKEEQIYASRLELFVCGVKQGKLKKVFLFLVARPLRPLSRA